MTAPDAIPVTTAVGLCVVGTAAVAALLALACLVGRALKRAAAAQTLPLDAGPLLGRDTASRRAARHVLTRGEV